MIKNKQKILHLSEKLMELVEVNDNGTILSSSRMLLTLGVIERGLVAQQEKFNSYLEKTFAKATPKKITTEKVELVLSAEDFIFTTLITDKDKDVFRTIKKELSGSIDDWLYNDQVFYHPEKNVKSVVITAVKKNVFLNWQKVLDNDNFLLESFTPDYAGLVACVEQYGLQAVLDIGSERSKLIVVLDGKIIWGENLPFGEKSWWRLIKEFKDLDEKEILNQYSSLIKPRARKNSLSDKAVNGFSQLSELIDAGLNDFEKFYGRQVGKITVFGQMTSVKGLNDVLSKQLKMSVNIGFCPAKKIKSQNFVRAWGAAKISLNSSIYKISMARSSNEKHSPSIEDEEVEEIRSVTTKVKARSVDAANHNTYSRPKKSSTMSITIVLLLLFALASASIWFYSNWQNSQPINVSENNVIDTGAQAETKTINAEIRFSFMADAVDASGQRLARTVKVQANTVSTSTDQGLALASADLAEDEALWPVMFGEDTWLIYRQPLLQTTAQEYLRSLQSTSTNSIFVNSVIPKRISVGKKEGEFNVVAGVEIKMASDLDLELPENQDLIASSTTTSTTTVLQDGEVMIANTPAGWANVRSGAGLQNKIVGKVNDGEKYEILEQESEWYKIKLTGGEIAWVIKKYTTVK